MDKEAVYKMIKESSINSNEMFDNVSNLSKDDISSLLDKLYCEWDDARHNLDEQIIVNNSFARNFYIYEAYELEAKAKFLFVKAVYMMKK